MKELQQHLLYLLLLAAVQTAGSLVQNQYPSGELLMGTDCYDCFSPWLTEDTPGEDDELPGGGGDDSLAVLQLRVQPCWQGELQL